MPEAADSSNTCYRIVIIYHSVVRILVVDSLPLKVIIMLDVDRTMNNGLPRIEKVEQGQEGEGNADPIPREANI